MRKYDRSLEEVWDWKEKVYQEVKDFTPSEYLKKLDCDAGLLMLLHGIKLRTVRREDMRLAA
jgi:hypothetical protein